MQRQRFAQVLVVMAAVIAFAFAQDARAQERIGIGYSMVDDGGCPVTGHILTAEC